MYDPLSNNRIVGIFDDVKKLFKDYHIRLYGTVELNDIDMLREKTANIWGLAKASRIILQKKMKYKVLSIILNGSITIWI